MQLHPFAPNLGRSPRSGARRARLVALALLSLVLLTLTPKTYAAEIDDAKAYFARTAFLQSLGSAAAFQETSPGVYATEVAGTVVEVTKFEEPNVTTQWIALVRLSPTQKAQLEKNLGVAKTPAILVAEQSGEAKTLQSRFPLLPASLRWDAGANVYGTIDATQGKLASLKAIGLVPAEVSFHGNFTAALFKELSPTTTWNASLKIHMDGWSDRAMPITAESADITVSKTGGPKPSMTISGKLTRIKVKGFEQTSGEKNTWVLGSAALVLTAGTPSGVQVSLNGFFASNFPLKNLIFEYTGGMSPKSQLRATLSVPEIKNGSKTQLPISVIGTMSNGTLGFAAKLKSRWNSPFWIPKVAVETGSSISIAVAKASVELGFSGGLLVDNRNIGSGDICAKMTGATVSGLGFTLPEMELDVKSIVAMAGNVAAKSTVASQWTAWTDGSAEIPLPKFSKAKASFYTPLLGCPKYANKQGVGGSINGTGSIDGSSFGNVTMTFAMNGNTNDGLDLGLDFFLGTTVIKVNSKIKPSASEAVFSADVGNLSTSFGNEMLQQLQKKKSETKSAYDSLNQSRASYAQLVRDGRAPDISPSSLCSGNGLCEQILRESYKAANYASDWMTKAADLARKEIQNWAEHSMHEGLGKFLSSSGPLTVKSAMVYVELRPALAKSKLSLEVAFLGVSAMKDFTLALAPDNWKPAEVDSLAESAFRPISEPARPQLRGKATTVTINEFQRPYNLYGSRRVLAVKVAAADGRPISCGEDTNHPTGTVALYARRGAMSATSDLEERAAKGAVMPASLADGSKENDAEPLRFNDFKETAGDYYIRLRGTERLEELRGRWTIYALYYGGGPGSCSGNTSASTPNDSPLFGYRYSIGKFEWNNGRADDVGGIEPKSLAVASHYPYYQATGDCPAGTYASSFNQRVEPFQKSEDDTGLNSVELVCRTPTSSETTGTVVWSHKGHWGTWSNGGFCPAGKFLTTASLKSMGDVGDDTFGQAAGFTCSDGTTVLRGTNEVPHDKMGGEWEHASCPVDTAICGISVDMRPNLGKGGDDTAMSGMRLRCCALPK